MDKQQTVYLHKLYQCERAWMGGGGGVLNSLFNKNIDINSAFGKYKVNTIKYDISKYIYLFDKMWIQQMFIR